MSREKLQEKIKIMKDYRKNKTEKGCRKIIHQRMFTRKNGNDERLQEDKELENIAKKKREKKNK